MGNLREQEVHSAALLGLGFVPGEVHYLASGSGVPYGFLRDSRRVPTSRLHTSLSDAYDAVGRMNGNNNVVVVSPNSRDLAAATVFNKNMTHIVGAFPLAHGPSLNCRVKFEQSAAATPMITVSGYGNLFQNLYTMHGYSSADYIGWLISGARNRFREVHFGGPLASALGGHASYEGVAIDGSENYFKHCVFGTDTIGRDETSPNVTLGAETLTTFDECLFLLYLTDGDPVFVAVENTSGYTWARFKNCQFMAFSSNYATPQTVAFKFSGGSSCAMVFDNNCQFQNVSAICDTAYDQYIWLPRQFVSTTDTEGMRSVQLTI